MRVCRRLLLCSVLCVAQHAWSRACHYSSWSDNPRPYLEAIQRSSSADHSKLASGQSVRAGIVTHHFLANGMMVKFFEGLRDEASPDVIVLIGPNHFHHGRGNISLSSLPWKTPFGMLETDGRAVQQIKRATNLPEDTEAFTGEHSVGVLVPFLKYYFPHSRVVPILIDVNAEEIRLEQLRPLLRSFLSNPRVLVLLSMDFSHNSIAGIADSRDELADQVISTLDARRVDELHVDCHKGLRILLSSLRDLGHVTVQINEHTNSSRLTRNPKQTNVTSYFTVAFRM